MLRILILSLSQVSTFNCVHSMLLNFTGCLNDCFNNIILGSYLKIQLNHSQSSQNLPPPLLTVYDGRCNYDKWKLKIRLSYNNFMLECILEIFSSFARYTKFVISLPIFHCVFDLINFSKLKMKTTSKWRQPQNEVNLKN